MLFGFQSGHATVPWALGFLELAQRKTGLKHRNQRIVDVLFSEGDVLQRIFVMERGRGGIDAGTLIDGRAVLELAVGVAAGFDGQCGRTGFHEHLFVGSLLVRVM